MSILDKFSRVSRAYRCPVCGKFDWCLVSRANPQDPEEVICARVESDYRAGEAGWWHCIRPNTCPPCDPLIRVIQPRKPTRDFETIAAEFECAAADEMIVGLAESLSVSGEGLSRLHVGWASARRLERLDTRCHGRGCWSFPMRGADGAIVGIRLRSEDGFKYSVKGGANGLFIPSELRNEDGLLIAEGPTDTAALLDMGFSAIGRPSCQEGRKRIQQYLQRIPVPHAVILADNDGPGQQGAELLAGMIRLYCPDVRVISPPRNHQRRPGLETVRRDRRRSHASGKHG